MERVLLFIIPFIIWVLWNYFVSKRKRFRKLKYQWNFKREKTALYFAVKQGDEKEALRLIKEEWYYVRNDIGFSSIRTKASYYNYHMFQLLAPSSWYPECYLQNYSISKTNNEFAKLKIYDYLCDTVYSSHPGINPLPLVLRFVPENVYVIKKILDLGFDPNIRDSRGNNCLHMISSGPGISYVQDTKRVAKMFLDKGVDINSKNFFENTPLHIAVSKVINSVVDLYLQRGADINQMNSEKLTPFDIAVRLNKKSCCTLLLKYTALRKHQGCPINKSIMEHIEANPSFKVKYREFDEQLESLKFIKIIDSSNFTYHHILKLGVYKVARLLANEGIRDGIMNYTTTRNSYECDIFRKIFEALRIKKVQNVATMVLNEIFQDKLPYVCTQRISSFFNHRDLDALKSFLNLEDTSTSQ